MKSSIGFYGGTGWVTGANFIYKNSEVSLAIDCGLVQGGDDVERKNFLPFKYDPQTIDALVLTHAHLDHVGRIPRLIKQGFRGQIYMTPATKEMAELILFDSLKIFSQKYPDELFYTEDDIYTFKSLIQTKEYGELFEIKNLKCVFRDAGHILGSAMLEFFDPDIKKKVVFTGDLGNSPSLLLKDTEKIEGVNYLVMESVYGNRNHESVEGGRRTQLKHALEYSLHHDGTVLIPTFSIEKTQSILYELNELVESGQIPQVPVFLDSPLAIKITDIYSRYTNLFNDKTREDIAKGDEIFSFPNLHMTKSIRDSEEINETKGAKIILAGSGMSMGGRIRDHEKKYLKGENNSLILVGYQTLGTLGRLLREGVKKVRIDDEYVNVRAKTFVIDSYSSHKGSDDLVSFVGDSAETLEKVFCVMGEPSSSMALAQKINNEYGVDASAPDLGDVILL